MLIKRFWAFLLVVTPAAAHEWYPIDCCSGLDCAPVEQVQLMPNAEMIVTSKHGTTLVPASFPTRDSRDHRMHVCMRPDGSGSMRTICVFLPPAM